jgi:NADPH-dependent 2,4-dienoyl-CoA reductase/sulfur reductase-like enzyme
LTHCSIGLGIRHKELSLDKQVVKKKVLVIGGGFGGVFAAKALARLGRGKLDVELVNANNYSSSPCSPK